MNIISIQGKNFKQFRDTKYYCDENGTIYSDFSHKILKPMLKGPKNKQYYYVDINFGNGQRHCYIHKIVYETWIGEIPKDKQVLHKDDNQFNNNINNLYLGDQKQNIQDCKDNNHKVGNTWILTIFDKEKNETITFCPASDFIAYCGHPCQNGGIKRMFSRNWFKTRYDIIDYYLCKSIDMKKGVTTMGDECNPVSQNLSLAEARNTSNSEEIV